MNKIGISNITLAVLLIISAILAMFFYSKNNTIAAEISFAEQIDLFGAVLEYFLYWTYALLALGVLLVVGFGLLGMFSNPGNLVKTGLSLAVVAALIVVAYFIAKSETTQVLNLPGYTGPDNNIETLVWSSVALYTTYFLMVGAFLVAVVTEFMKAFSK